MKKLLQNLWDAIKPRKKPVIIDQDIKLAIEKINQKLRELPKEQPKIKGLKMSRQFLLMVDENDCAMLQNLIPSLETLEVQGMDLGGNPLVKILVTPLQPAISPYEIAPPVPLDPSAGNPILNAEPDADDLPLPVPPIPVPPAPIPVPAPLPLPVPPLKPVIVPHVPPVQVRPAT